MGKRKLHSVTYYQCDWTGFPMHSTNCYMPAWNSEGKLLKHGSYCNWESVVAHAAETESPEMSDKIHEYVNAQIGAIVNPAPHYKTLQWFNKRDGLSIEEFHSECSKPTGPLIAVRLKSDGQAREVIVEPKDIEQRFTRFLQTPYTCHGPLHKPASFHTTRKKPYSKERDLAVFYWPQKNGLLFNSTASNLLKQQIYGDVLLIQQSREPSQWPRERFVNYYYTNFEEQYPVQKKRKEHSDALSIADYAKAKQAMTTSLESVEVLASSLAVQPAELAKASNLPPACGRELAALVDPTGDQRASLRAASSQPVA